MVEARRQRGIAWLALLLCSACALSACGQTRVVTQTVEHTVTTPPAPKDTGGKLAILSKPLRNGEFVVRGDTAPKSFGPYNFEPGVWKFQFEQYDPQDPHLDFTTEAGNFAVSINRKPRVNAPDSQLLVNSSVKQGDNQLEAAGKLYVDVTAADHSYVLRFTPQP